MRGGAGEGDKANYPITISWQTRKEKNTQEVLRAVHEKSGEVIIGIVFCAFALQRFVYYMCLYV